MQVGAREGSVLIHTRKRRCNPRREFQEQISCLVFDEKVNVGGPVGRVVLGRYHSKTLALKTPLLLQIKQ
jgi:hypothetical protein